MNALPSPEQVRADLAGTDRVRLGRLRNLYNVREVRWRRLLACVGVTPQGQAWLVSDVLRALRENTERESPHAASVRLGLRPRAVLDACEWAGLTTPHPSGHSGQWHWLRREDIDRAVTAYAARERKTPVKFQRPPCANCGKPVRFLKCGHCSIKCAQVTRFAAQRERAARWRQRYEAGESVYRIAKDEGVNSGTVGYAVGKYQRSAGRAA